MAKHAEVSTYRLTHKTLKQNGRKLSIVVSLRIDTIDNLNIKPSPLAVMRAENAICGKFRMAAGKEFFGGKWPDGLRVTIDDLEYDVEVEPAPTSTNRRHGS